VHCLRWVFNNKHWGLRRLEAAGRRLGGGSAATMLIVDLTLSNKGALELATRKFFHDESISSILVSRLGQPS